MCGPYTLYTSTTDDGTLLLQYTKTNIGILPIEYIVFWMWGKLGKDNRRPLPACIVKAVREKYLSVSGAYRGFQLPKLSN